MGIRWWIKGSLIAIILVLITFMSTIARLFTDYWWFDALGFSKVFMISLKTKLMLFFVVAGLFFIF
ncbi:MAG: UPF0182 family protein, partial [Nanoarchaeota archaeon]|nr:UPF0182 family protein [Nanoarchaeota archaeon]